MQNSYVLLLNVNEDIKKVEEEERTKFLKSVIEQVGIQFESSNDLLSIEEKIQLRKPSCNTKSML